MEKRHSEDWYFEQCIPGWMQMSPAERAAALKEFDEKIEASDQLNLFVEHGGELS